MTLKQVAYQHRNLVQLVTLLALFAGYPLAANRVVGRLFMDLMFTAVLIAAVSSLSTRPRFFRPAIGLAVISLVLLWANRFVGQANSGLSVGLLGLFFAYILAVSFADLLRGRAAVTRETVFQSLNIYLFLGMVFAALFAWIEITHPGSLNVADGQHSALQGMGSGGRDWFALTFYFSFINLTTVGFGDITPATDLTRSLCIVEAVIGQFYLAVLVARLIGLQIAQGPASPD